MSCMYAMRRANGDWFAFEEHGPLCVPVFCSSRAAMRAREHNRGMLLFEPVVFDESALDGLAPTGGETGVHFWLADGSSTRPGRGRLIDHAQLALLLHEPRGDSKNVGEAQNDLVLPELRHGAAAVEDKLHQLP